MIPLNPDFKELLSCLLAADARFLLVGGYALAFHGHPCATKDMDVWVEPTPDNAARVLHALEAFGAPTRDVTAEDLANRNTVFQIGVPPRRVDLVCSIDGVDFATAWADRETRHLVDPSALQARFQRCSVLWSVETGRTMAKVVPSCKSRTPIASLDPCWAGW
jgi:hypothetical protein